MRIARNWYSSVNIILLIWKKRCFMFLQSSKFPFALLWGNNQGDANLWVNRPKYVTPAALYCQDFNDLGVNKSGVRIRICDFMLCCGLCNGSIWRCTSMGIHFYPKCILHSFQKFAFKHWLSMHASVYSLRTTSVLLTSVVSLLDCLIISLSRHWTRVIEEHTAYCTLVCLRRDRNQ